MSRCFKIPMCGLNHDKFCCWIEHSVSRIGPHQVYLWRVVVQPVTIGPLRNGGYLAYSSETVLPCREGDQFSGHQSLGLEPVDLELGPLCGEFNPRNWAKPRQQVGFDAHLLRTSALCHGRQLSSDRVGMFGVTSG
jgi:hypothetical protein